MSDSAKLGAYAPPPDEYDTFDARAAEPERRGPLLLVVAAAVFVLFVAVVFSAYNQGVRDRSDAPVVARDSEPFRRAPDDPGGYETPGQDIEAYELRNASANEAADSDPPVVTGQPEEPVEAPGLQVETVDADEIAPTPAPALDALRTDPAEDDEPAASETAPEPAPDPAPALEPEPEPAPAQAPAVVAAGDWVVQIAAFRTRDEAEAGWIAFRTRYADLAQGRAPDVETADLGARGIYHRLRIAAFAERGEAETFCRALQQAGQDCLVTRR
ncbi:MAG: SPOR domain-containing protein [Pseudomonadota bacterium]